MCKRKGYRDFKITRVVQIVDFANHFCDWLPIHPLQQHLDNCEFNKSDGIYCRNYVLLSKTVTSLPQDIVNRCERHCKIWEVIFRLSATCLMTERIVHLGDFAILKNAQAVIDNLSILSN